MTEEVTKSILDQVVELKGNEDFRNPETLAKSVLNSDSHIKNIERQNKELREDLEKRMKSEEILKAIEAKAEEIAQSTSRFERTPAEPSTTGLDPEKVEAIVLETFNKRTMEEKTKANRDFVNSKLKENFGDTAVETIKARSAELGMSPEELVRIADNSPNAFMTLMGSPTQIQKNSQPNSEVNTQSGSFTNSPDRDYNFYEKMRRENPKVYYNPKTQKQLLADAVRLGDKWR